MILYPNAKVNIGLDILFKRHDGFHELDTLMHPIALTDILTINKFEGKHEKIRFSTTGIHIDGSPEDNLIHKAYNLLDARYNLPPLDIHLHKSIPFGAGLGGGSADCAFAITGINALCQLNLSVKNMQEIAAELGSDCPFFIENKPAIAKGRGELLKPFNINLSSYTFMVVIPNFAINTKSAYKYVSPYTPETPLEVNLTAPIGTWKNSVKNAFEASVFKQFDEIKQIKEKLYKLGAVYASLSGSGSAVFGIFTKPISVEGMFPKEYFIWMQ